MLRLPDKLYRFTKREFADQFISSGRLCFSHARTFTGESLTAAQQDDERRRCYSFENVEKKYFAPDQRGELHHILSMTIFMTNGDGFSPRDYYMLCFSLQFDDRMFEDFQADVYIEMDNPERFFERLSSAMKVQYPIGGKLRAFPVEYFDPNLPPVPRDFDDYVFMKNSSRYDYQKEFRVAIEVAGVDPFPDRLFIDLGDLSDICTVHERKRKAVDS